MLECRSFTAALMQKLVLLWSGFLTALALL
jgi:hypothetical protein